MSREKLLDEVAAEVAICTRCPLWKTRKKAVPGEGNPKAIAMLIGEAPGVSEDLEGRPFVGAAGRFLEALLSEIGFSRGDLFICNVLKCRPPRNRPPKPEEVQTCTPYLNRQIQIIKPKFIITLGNYSTAYIFSKARVPYTSITAVHGKVHEANLHGMRIAVFPTLHPAAALYSAKYKEQIARDFQLLKVKLEKRKMS